MLKTLTLPEMSEIDAHFMFNEIDSHFKLLNQF